MPAGWAGVLLQLTEQAGKALQYTNTSVGKERRLWRLRGQRMSEEGKLWAGASLRCEGHTSTARTEQRTRTADNK